MYFKCGFEDEVSCCGGTFVSSVDGLFVFDSSLVSVKGGSGSEEGIRPEEGFCFDEVSPRSSKELRLRGGLVVKQGAFLGLDFGAGFCLEGSIKG
jgi:hypothetical protein